MVAIEGGGNALLEGWIRQQISGELLDNELIEGLIAIRFCLLLLGANPASGFVNAMYAITAPFVAPFVGIFGTPRFQGSVFEPHSLVALVMYALLSWVLAQIVWLALADTSANVATRTSTVRSETEHERSRDVAA